MSDDFEPIIILSTEDYEKATAPEGPAPQAAPPPPPPKPERTKRPRPAPAPARRSILRPLLSYGTLLLITIGGVAAYQRMPALDAPLPPDGPLLTRKTAPKPPPPPKPMQPEPAPMAAVPPAPAVEPPRPAAPPPPEPAVVRPAGSFTVRVVLDGGGVRQESLLAVKAAWDGARYRFDADESAAFERVRLLLAMPPSSGGAGGRTTTVNVGDASCECRLQDDGETRTWELAHPSRAIVRIESPSWRREPTRLGSERATASGRSLPCLVIDGEDRFAAGPRRYRQWFADEFPFGALRAEQSSAGLVVRCEVVDYRLEK
jgi:hypothetical protein